MSSGLNKGHRELDWTDSVSPTGAIVSTRWQAQVAYAPAEFMLPKPSRSSREGCEKTGICRSFY